VSHEADVELARRCLAGDESAWERFVLEYRPVLHRAAQALDPSGGAREIADSLYAELYGIRSAREDQPRSLFRYFTGRSSLATWLRAVLVQRYIDRKRAARRLEPLPDEGANAVGAARSARALSAAPADVDRDRRVGLVRTALARAVAQLASRDRLRLACYYAQELTLAETGRALGEHEATVSRQIARTRRVLRDAVARDLVNAGLGDSEVAECFRDAAQDPGPIDLNELLAAAERKPPAAAPSESSV